MITRFVHPWPSRAHRSWAEVAETDRLLAMPRLEVNKLGLSTRLENLLRKAKAFNPPSADEEDAAA